MALKVNNVPNIMLGVKLRWLPLKSEDLEVGVVTLKLECGISLISIKLFSSTIHAHIFTYVSMPVTATVLSGCQKS